jgi:hypothetical protein
MGPDITEKRRAKEHIMSELQYRQGMANEVKRFGLQEALVGMCCCVTSAR